MDDSYLRAKDVIAKLIEDDIITVAKDTFSKAVKSGALPHRRLDGISHKLFDYSTIASTIRQNAMFGYDPEIEKANIKAKKQRNSKPSADKNELSREQLQERLNTNPKLSDANTLKTIIQVEQQQLKLDEDLGRLIPRALVEDSVFKGCRVVRDKLLTIPERVSNELASMTNAHDIKELLYKEQISALESFTPELLMPQEVKC